MNTTENSLLPVDVYIAPPKTPTTPTKAVSAKVESEQDTASQKKFSTLKTPKEQIAFVKKQLATSDKWLERGLLAIYKNQTSQEQSSYTTIEHNGVGFNGVDATFLSSVAKRVLEGKPMSPRQIVCVRKSMAKYASQLVDIANRS